IYEIVDFWDSVAKGYGYSDEKIDEAKSIKKEIEEMDKIEFDPSTITATIHPNAVYTSRLLKFTNLSQPVNSNTVTIIGNNNGNHHQSIINCFLLSFKVFNMIILLFL